MRADLFSRTSYTCRLIGLSLIALVATGCKTEKDPDQPTLLGAPPATAYLGVEYYYNWGAYGGESILDYSLTNAPSWLALEDTSNKARQGVIMRGVPGLSGGGRGESDLGKTENIDIVSTDGRMAGFQPFDVEVKRNVLSLEAPTFIEGQSPDIADSSRERCVLPGLETTGEHSFDIDLYEDDGSSNVSKAVTAETNRVYVKVLLDQPSFTRVSVAFELRSEFDENACDDEQEPPHQSCEYSSDNLGRAIIGNDIVARGNASPLPTDEDGNNLEYIQYFTNDQGVYDRGVITLEPGITECYIPLEVIDDVIPEPSELVQLVLTEVRTGIASLGDSDTEVRSTLTIQDNEPVVSIETRYGGPRDTLNTGEVRSYRAILTGDRDGPVEVRLTQAQGSTARLGTEFFIEQDGLANATLEFPTGQDELIFEIRATDSYTAPDDLNDRFGQLAVDNAYQAGREGFARGASDNLLRVNLNRLSQHLTWTDGFVPTDLAVGHGGRLFVAGHQNDEVQVRLYDQSGTPLGNPIVVATLSPGAQPDVFLDVAERRVTENRVRVSRYELAVAFSTDESIGTGGASGVVDVVTGLYRLQSNGQYELRWDDLHRIGSSGDDRVRWVGLNAGSGHVVVAGETDGVWSGETEAGGIDTFLARIDSVPDGETLVPTLAWSRQVGSSGNDRVVGGSAQTLNPLLFGHAPMSIDGTAVTGPFFFSGNANGAPTVYQVGEDSSENLQHGFYGDGSVWLVGDAPKSYSVQVDTDDETELVRTGLDTRAGFALGYSTTGEIGSALMARGFDENANVTLRQGMVFDGDIVVGGATDGQFAPSASPSGAVQAVLGRLNRSEDDAEYRSWRGQFTMSGLRIRRLLNYRDDEIVALVDQNGAPAILLFSPEGELLTKD
ncbi:MAG: hypothetical protein HLUCCX14_13810 [Marinobacter excellens HL-55]|uniref:Uncharacterized protein n=1 Tax=Marinobacter excellens HL-55 TaxID=1305731 RepID=A0A0P8BH81_9GAMM|nr:MAG: hypothetical protein HLUCCX14_13810 [Marinobacter excellens HL-55]